MSLVPYTVTALQRDVADAALTGKQVISGAVITMTNNPSGTAVVMYDNAASGGGATSKITGSDGTVVVWVEPAKYNLTINGTTTQITVAVDGATLGTSSTADVTTSATDTTAGRVTKVGDGGWLGIAPTITNFDTELNTTQTFYATSAAANLPKAGSINWGGMRISSSNANNGVELAFGTTAPDGLFMFRAENAASYGGWKEIYHSGNSVNPLDLYTTTELIASSLTKYATNELITTYGYSTLGGHTPAIWKKTATIVAASQTPVDLGEAAFSDADGKKWTYVSNGIIDVAHMGAINGATSGNNADTFFDVVTAHCLSTGDKWTAKGNYWVNSIYVYTDFVGNATFYSSNGGQVDSVVNIYPIASNLAAESTAVVQALLPFSKGQSKIAGLGAYAGKVLRVATAERYLERVGSAVDYRYDTTFYVLNSDGDITPPIPHDFPDTLTISIFNSEIAQETLSIKNLSVIISTGTTPRTSVISSGRSNTELEFYIKNTTTSNILQMLQITAGYNNKLINCNVNGAKVNTTNYGYNLTGANHSLINCNATDCRRGVDGTYMNGLTIIGGVYPNGIGAHLGFNTKISGVEYIGNSSANVNSLHFTGGDVTVENSTVITKTGSIFQVRTDAPECIGRISILNCKLIFDWTALAGSPDGELFSHNPPAAGYTGARDLVEADHIQFKNNTVSVLGDGHTGFVNLVDMYATGSITSDIIADSFIEFSGNKYIFDNDLPSIKGTINKANYLAGNGIKFIMDDYITWTPYFGNAVNTTTEPFLNVVSKNLSASSIRGDYGWLVNSEIKNATYIAATGTPAYLPSANWLTVNNAGSIYRTLVIADDAVITIDKPSNYFNLEYYRLNDVTRSAKYIIDADGVGQVGAVYEVGAVANAGNLVLTGTTGTDGNITISCDGTVVYIENRSGVASTLAVRIGNSIL